MQLFFFIFNRNTFIILLLRRCGLNADLYLLKERSAPPDVIGFFVAVIAPGEK